MNKKRSKKKKKRSKILLLRIVNFILFVVLIFCAVNVFKWQKDNNEIKDLSLEFNNISTITLPNDDVEGVNPPEDQESDYWYYVKLPLTQVDLTELKKKNSDTVGFLSVSNTNINYPVVQAKNNEYYLNRSFNKTYNGAGWVFADYRNDMNNFDQNTIIYGHSRLDKSLFGTLRKILSTSWVNNKENHVIRLSTMEENTLWQVFSVYKIKAESYYITPRFKSDTEYSKWLNTMMSRSEYNFNTSVNTNDKILTLSTCWDTKGNRVVMHAKLIKKAKA